MNGVINLYKEKGITSFGAVSAVRKILHVKKVGHTGTLDPEAEGVLPICVGKATKLVDYIMGGEKTYRAGFRLGYTSDTLDAFGVVTKTDGEVPHEDLVRETISGFLGDSMQMPPMYSALKKDGKRLYELARQGIEIERERRPISITKLELCKFDGVEGEILVQCSKGTYIRSLIDEIGEKLQCGAIMTSLVREATGSFMLENSVKLKTLEENGYEEYLISMDEVLKEYEKFIIPEEFLKLIANGVKVKNRKITSTLGNGLYRAYSEEGSFLGILKRDEDYLFLAVNLM